MTVRPPAPSPFVPLLVALACLGCAANSGDVNPRDMAPPPGEDPRVTSADAGTTDAGRPPTPTPAPTEPVAEACDDGLDDDADGSVDEGCTCTIGASQACFVGDPTLAGVSGCAMGTMTCEASGEFGVWGACAGSGAPLDETCNDADDDCDGAVDEGLDCVCLEAGATPWQEWLREELVCFDCQDLNEDRRQFDYAPSIPGRASPVWGGRTLERIDFDDDTTIDDDDLDDQCGCGGDGSHRGGVYTYFQTFVTLPPGLSPSSFAVRIGGSDDGAQLFVFNSRYPAGHTERSWHVFDGGATWDITSYLALGEENRIVLIHIDDNPRGRELSRVELLLDGSPLTGC